jgi:hypothetical protein
MVPRVFINGDDERYMRADQTGQRPALSHRNLIRLYDYWDERRSGRAFPARRDVDPLEFAYVLGNVVLIDVLYQPLRFRYRLVGVNLVRRDGFDMTGKMVDEFPEPEFRQHLIAVFSTVVESGRPLRGVRDLFVDGRTRQYEALSLPLSDDGQEINMLLIATEYVA